MPDLPPGPAWLFCPADRPDRYAKAASAADVVILDLEDGVAPEARPASREAIAAAAADLDPRTTVIRINPAGTSDHHADLDALSRLPFDLVMLPKTEAAAQLEELTGLGVVALCETPRGVRAAGAIAASGHCLALMWGAEDLLAALGGTSSRDERGRYRDVARHARNEILLAAAASGVTALDSVYLDIGDLEGLRAEAADASASGFAAKACIHPDQAEVVRSAFRPTDSQIAWAGRVLDAAAAHPHGVFSLGRQMIDEPLIRQAHRITASAEPIPPEEPIPPAEPVSPTGSSDSAHHPRKQP